MKTRFRRAIGERKAFAAWEKHKKRVRMKRRAADRAARKTRRAQRRAAWRR